MRCNTPIAQEPPPSSSLSALPPPRILNQSARPTQDTGQGTLESRDRFALIVENVSGKHVTRTTFGINPGLDFIKSDHWSRLTCQCLSIND